MRNIDMRSVCFAIFVLVGSAAVDSAFPQSAPPQARPDNGDSAPQVVLEKLTPPAYPQMAKIAQIAGEVVLKVYVHPDGSIESVTALSGHPILIQAAVESANRSQFKCSGCNGIS